MKGGVFGMLSDAAIAGEGLMGEKPKGGLPADNLLNPNPKAVKLTLSQIERRRISNLQSETPPFNRWNTELELPLTGGAVTARHRGKHGASFTGAFISTLPALPPSSLQTALCSSSLTNH